MPFPPEIEAARKDVFELIGRNVLRFQKIELVLKHLVSRSDISFNLGNPPPVPRFKDVETKSLGLVAGDYFKNVFLPFDTANEATPKQDPGVNGKVPQARGRFRMQLPAEAHSELEKRFLALVEERNHLIHSFLLKFNLETLDGCSEAATFLEAQAKKIAVELQSLKEAHEAFTEMLEALKTEMASDEFRSRVRGDASKAKDQTDRGSSL